MKRPSYRCLRSKRSAVLWLILTLFLGLSAQDRDYRFGHLSIEDGLSQNLIFSIVQDSKGFLWVGTYDGLNRYDGYEFHIYTHRPPDSLSLMANQVYALYEDREQQLWVGAGGLNLYDRNNDRFIRVVSAEQIGNDLAEIQIQDITEDHHGNIWFYVRNAGLYCLERRNGKSDAAGSGKVILNSKLIGPYRMPDEISARFMGTEICFLAAPRNTVWLSTENGIMMLDTTTGEPSPDPDQSRFVNVMFNQLPADNKYHELWVDGDEGLWIGTRAGLIYLANPNQPDLYEFYPFPLGQFKASRLATPRSMAVDQTGVLWIATYEGVLLFDLSSKTFEHLLYDPEDPEGLSYPSITEVFVDRGNIVWLGTAGMGLNSYARHRKQFKHYLGKQLTHTIYSVYDLLEGPKGDIWFSALSGSLFHYQKKTGAVRLIPPPSPLAQWAISDMIRDANGIFWFSNDHLLIRYDPGSGNSNIYTITQRDDADYFLADSMNLITLDPSGDIWLTNTRTIKRFHPGRGITEQYGLPEAMLERVNACYYDNRGVFWLASMNGLLRYDCNNGHWQWYRSDPGLPGTLPYYHLTSLQPDPSDPERILWIGTGGGGLVRLDMLHDTFTNYTSEEGLPNNYIYGILTDEAGDLWMSTNHGLSCFDPRAGTFNNYDLTHGLQSNEFNTRSCYRSPGGELFFGGINGITAFFPHRIITNPYIPPVVITGMQLSYEPVRAGERGSPLPYNITETKLIRLKHSQRTLAFEFAALDYTYPGKNQYRYRLQGFDEQWIGAGTNRRAFYTNLPAGKYLFEVTGSNNDGVFNQEVTAMEVIIPQHPWMRWYALMLYAAMLATAGYFFHRYLFERRQTKQEIRRREEETRRLTELDQFKSQFFANVSHEFRTPISLIEAHLEDLLLELKRADLREKVVSARRNSEELLRLIDQLLDLARLEANRMKLDPVIHNLVPFVKEMVETLKPAARQRRLSLEFGTDQEQIFAAFDTSAMQKIIQNLVFNALKFTEPGGHVRVRLESRGLPDPGEPQKDHSYLLIHVADTGIGIPKEHLQRIFDRFYQVRNQSGQPREGFGLGLGMVRELTELHGGSIHVESEPGKGSVFTIQLPALARERALVVPPIQKKPQEVAPDPVPTEAEFRLDEGSPNTQYPWSSLAAREILVVEDHPELREYIQTILQKEYQVVLASNGSEGIETARKHMPDLIVSDIMMPEMDGYELTRQLQNDQRTSHIPVILLTAKADMEDRLKGLDLGADDYLVKPFKQKELLSRVRNILRKREELQKKYTGVVLEGKALEKEPTTEQLFLKKIRRLIEEHLGNESFGVEQLAEAVHMSPSNLYRKLNALTNLSAIQLINQIRLEKAVHLLEQGLQVSEVSYRLGFQNPSSFTNFFRKQYGISPREFMNQ